MTPRPHLGVAEAFRAPLVDHAQPRHDGFCRCRRCRPPSLATRLERWSRPGPEAAPPARVTLAILLLGMILITLTLAALRGVRG